MMVMNLALPLEHFGGFRPAHCQGKAYTTKRLAAINGRAYRQQSTKSGRGRNGKDNNDNGKDGNNNGQGRRRQQGILGQRHRWLSMAGLTDNNQPKMAEEEMARTTRTMGKDGNDNGRGRQRWQGRQKRG